MKCSVLLLAVIFFSANGSSLVSGGTCDDDWTYWEENTMCYYFSPYKAYYQQESVRKDNMEDWFTARDYCRRSNGDLVSIDSDGENNFVWENVKNKGSSNADGLEVWIGFSDSNLVHNGYSWSDGTESNYTNWNAPKEPNNWKGQEYCAAMKRDNGEWNDNACHLRRTFVCKKHNNNVDIPQPPSTPAPELGECDSGWSSNDKSCYKFVDDPKKDWDDAQSECTNLNAHLVIIDNETEQKFLETTFSAQYTGKVWIGLNDKHSEGEFAWVDYTRPKYSNWKPKNYGNKDCIAMFRKWDNEECSDTLGYICETERT